MWLVCQQVSAKKEVITRGGDDPLHISGKPVASGRPRYVSHFPGRIVDPPLPGSVEEVIMREQRRERKAAALLNE